MVVCLKRKNGEIVQGCTLYIGRQWSMGGWTLPKSKWYNPYTLKKDGPSALDKFESYVRVDLLDSLAEIGGHVLGCWCKGARACHGDVLVKLYRERFPHASPMEGAAEACRTVPPHPGESSVLRPPVHAGPSAAGVEILAHTFGQIIHWGVYACPAYTPSLTRAERNRKVCNGSEWYADRLRRPKRYGDATLDHHAKTHPGTEYREFLREFEGAAGDWKADEIADVAVSAGAQYVILTAKHHDGIALYPSKFGTLHTARDYVGELAAAVRRRGMAFGVYYSLMEWTGLYSAGPKTQKIKTYVAETMHPQMKELVSRYKPDIVWVDGDWNHTVDTWGSFDFLDWLFTESAVKDTVMVNDRWGKHKQRLVAHYADRMVPTVTDRYIPPSGGSRREERSWEHVNTVGLSWGRATNQDPAVYKSLEEVLRLRAAVWAKSGRFTLNVGLGADGSFDPKEQAIWGELASRVPDAEA
uniref:alpha-L-fucosidase n=1 Tax=Marseillevirus LCMAC103 TaxID=2506604 RepID=A0A481YVP5_9VIRU|nr:MAG: protein of unknown function DUF4326 [Marseillevirus LCMAC103]